MNVFLKIGSNDNPTAQQFEAAYRKLLVHNDVVCSVKANCIDRGTKILTVSSRRQGRAETAIVPGFDALISDEIIFDEILNNNFDSHSFVSDAHDHCLAYMASKLETKIITAKHPRVLIKCHECIGALVENELLEDSFIRFKARRTNITQPCKSTYDICRFIDLVLKQYESIGTSFGAIAMQVLRNLPFETLYTSTNFDTHSKDGHKYTFVKQIVELYMKLKSANLAKCLTTKSHEQGPIRHRYKKLIHEAGQ